MQSDKKKKENMFRDIYKSSVKASYFNHMAQNKFTAKSKIQIEEEEKEEQVDENTFRIMTGFVRPNDSYLVYNKKGRFYIEEEGFFSCLASRRRYDVELSNYRLRVDKSQTSLQQFFNFDTESIEIVSKGRYFLLKVQRCDKQFYFEPVEQHAKEQIVNDWVLLLNKAINTFEGHQKHHVYLPVKDKEFYTKEHVSHTQFEKQCNSLDVVLFKSQHSAATIQRMFTDSQYDHVGVVLRNKKNELFIFESSSGQGVGLTPWKHIVKFQWYNSTDKIAWRRLKINLTPQDISIIEAFVAKTLGKQFQISLNKLFTFNSLLKRDPEDDEKKTYFCSELIARLYKQLRLIDGQKASTRYYPVDFSDRAKAVFIREGVRFEAERLIAFNV